MPKGYVYILANKHNTTLYIGVTNNLRRRVYEHKNRLIKGFSSKYNTTKLVYYNEFETIERAIVEEKKLKNLVRRKKNSLISENNPEWRDLKILSARKARLQDDF